MTGQPTVSASPYVAIVRRGQGEVFLALDGCLAESGVDVVWDRRSAERRRRCETVPADRRARDRRGPPPSGWQWPGLVIIEGPDADPAPSPVPRPKRILLVEDDPRVREVLFQALAMGGYDVVAAADGEEALAAFREAPADLIITDLLMPRKDGVDTIRGLRDHHPDVRVIAVTAARGRFNRLIAARHVGADRTLLKPFNLGDLLTTVQDVLAR